MGNYILFVATASIYVSHENSNNPLITESSFRTNGIKVAAELVRSINYYDLIIM